MESITQVSNQLGQVAQQVLSDYEVLEPDEADTWNPVKSEYEIAYRLSLLYYTAKAVCLSSISLETAKLLDLGCGNGRSTRMYLDLGLCPEQLTGLDLRPGTINLARKLNPAINFLSYEGEALPFADQSFNWVSMAGVISQIQDVESRKNLITEIYRKLQPGGFVYNFDKFRASGLVGGGEVRPLQYFSPEQFRKIWYTPVRSYQFMSLKEKVANLFGREFSAGNGEFKKKFLTRLSQVVRPSHSVLLVQKC
ncbi:MAG: class I SAM-dependent methyltransferase [Oscillatoriales cyanobacterium C42_A2020_001]|nr:class I SAM-dependent methyltransferase [Leptolyngbyaceae cyanobacterium C42_A2020_001]